MPKLGEVVNSAQILRPSTRPPNLARSTWEKRPDGTWKDIGFLGPLPVTGGGAATEYSIPLFERGNPGDPSYERGPDIPTLVPTLTQSEIQMLTNDIIPNGKPIPRSIIDKAVAHAHQRMAAGLSPFFDSSKE